MKVVIIVFPYLLFCVFVYKSYSFYRTSFIKRNIREGSVVSKFRINLQRSTDPTHNSSNAVVRESFDLLDDTLKENDQWILELRGIVESKRGFSIWSNRSDEAIKMESKKIFATYLEMSSTVMNVIKVVYIDKLCSISDLKQEDEMSYMEFRKWMRERRGKTKKDPLSAAKLALVTNWLDQHPSSRSVSYSANNKRFRNLPSFYFQTKPSVILEEVTDLFDQVSERPATGKLWSDLPTTTTTNNTNHGVDVVHADAEKTFIRTGLLGAYVQNEGCNTQNEMGALNEVPSLKFWHKSTSEMKTKQRQYDYYPNHDRVGDGVAFFEFNEYFVAL